MKTNNNIPAYRFAGFTDAWEQRKLGEVVERVTRKNKKLLSKLPLTISAQYGLVDQEKFFNKQVASKDVSNYYLVKKGEFAYNKSYSNGYPWGAVKRLDRYEMGVLSTLYIVFKPKEEVNSDYLATYYDTTNWHAEVSMIAAEGARNHGLLNISANDFFETFLSLPSLPEQEAIGTFFSTLDRHITLHQRKLETMRELKKAFLQKLFPKGNEKTFPELRFPGFTEAWNERRLGDTNTFFTDGNYGEAYPKDSDLTTSSNGVPFLRGSNISEGRLTLDSANYITTSKHKELTSGHLEDDDLVIAVRGSLGSVGYVEKVSVGWNINSQLAIIRTNKDEILGRYLVQVFMSVSGKKQINSLVTGTALKQLPIKNLRALKIYFPTLPEQEVIGTFFSALDQQIAQQEQKLASLKEMKQTLLRKLFV